MFKMMDFYTVADQGEGPRGGGGLGVALYFYAKLQPRGQMKNIFEVGASSYLRDWFSGPPVTEVCVGEMNA